MAAVTDASGAFLGFWQAGTHRDPGAIRRRAVRGRGGRQRPSVPGVADADATCAQALGGKVVEAAVDAPYGRTTTLTDPSGTLFRSFRSELDQPARRSCSSGGA